MIDFKGSCKFDTTRGTVLKKPSVRTQSLWHRDCIYRADTGEKKFRDMAICSIGTKLPYTLVSPWCLEN